MMCVYTYLMYTVEPPLTAIFYSGHQNVAVRIEFALHMILNSSLKCGHLAIP